MAGNKAVSRDTIDSSPFVREHFSELGLFATLNEELIEAILMNLDVSSLLSIASTSKGTKCKYIDNARCRGKSCLLAYFDSADDQTIAFNLLANEETVWKLACIRKNYRDLRFEETWKQSILGKPSRFVQFQSYPNPMSSDYLRMRWCRSTIDLRNFVPGLAKDSVVEMIPRIPVTALTLEDFKRRFDHANMPVVLTEATRTWQASQCWTIDQLLEKYKHTQFRITHRMKVNRKQSNIKMSFEQFVRYMKSQKDEEPLYIFDGAFGEVAPQLLEDYDITALKFFDIDLFSVLSKKNDASNTSQHKGLPCDLPGSTDDETSDSSSYDSADDDDATFKRTEVLHYSQAPSANDGAVGKSPGDSSMAHRAKRSRQNDDPRPEYRWFLVGPQRSGAPWHIDPNQTSAWNALLVGKKRWALYPPGQVPPGIHVIMDDNNNVIDADSMSSLRWFMDVYPQLEPHEKPLEILQNPGDVIFVPNGWWHLVLNIEDTISVTQNFVNESNLQDVCTELMQLRPKDFFRFRDRLAKEYPHMQGWLNLFQVPYASDFASDQEFMSAMCKPKKWHHAIQKICKKHDLPLPSSLLSPKQKGGCGHSCLHGKCKASASVHRLSKKGRHNPVLGWDDAVLKLYSAYDDHHNLIVAGFDGEETNAAPTTSRPSVMESLSAQTSLQNIEVTAYRFLGNHPSLNKLVPKLLGHGVLYPRGVSKGHHPEPWKWPYILLSRPSRHCLSLGDLRRTNKDDSIVNMQNLAVWLARDFLRPLHSISIPITEPCQLSLPVGVHFPEREYPLYTWNYYRAFLKHQRAVCIRNLLEEDILPICLVRQIDAYLPSYEEVDNALLPRWATNSAGKRRGTKRHAAKGPALLHGDLNSDNVLGTGCFRAHEQRHENHLPPMEAPRTVFAWLEQLGFARYETNFAMHEIEHRDLSLLTDSHLKEIGIPVGPRLRMLQSIRDLNMGTQSSRRADVISIYVQAESSSDSSSSEESSDNSESEENEPRADSGSVVSWEPSHIVDFADARSGDPLYDVIAIYLCVLKGKKSLFKTFLSAYDGEDVLETRDQDRFAYRMMCLTLMHPSNALRGVISHYPEILEMQSWKEIQDRVFRLH